MSREVKSTMGSPNLAVGIALMGLILAPLAVAGDAVFSRDGKLVYTLSGDPGGKLYRIDFEMGTRGWVSLEKLIGDVEVIGLARSGDGSILCATDNEVWEWDDVEGKAVILSAAAEGRRIRGIAYDPSKRRVFMTTVETPAGSAAGGEDELMVKRSKSDSWEKVKTRRISLISGMAFAEGGDFVFCSEGDVWIGDVREDVIPQGSEDPERAAELAEGPSWVTSILDAYRIAPLATRETAEGTPGQMGVVAVVASRQHVYAHLRRMGGSGWGRVVRLALPETERDEDGYLNLVAGVEERAKMTASALATVEDLGSQSRRAFLCSSPGGERTYFLTADADGQTHWLATGDGAPRAVSIKDPD